MSKKIIYLTIDDAPSEIMNDKIEYLLCEEIPAIFFCEGAKLKDRGDVVINAIRKGFMIGNHSYSHPHFSKISVDKGKKEIKDTDDLINKLYLKADKKRPAKIFRFPYGDKGTSGKVKIYQEFLKNLGYSQPEFENIDDVWVNKKRIFEYYDVLWTYDSDDYKTENDYKKGKRESEETILAKMDKKFPGCMEGLSLNEYSDIVLVHDHPETKDLFIKMVDKLKSKGFEFRLPKLK